MNMTPYGFTLLRLGLVVWLTAVIPGCLPNKVARDLIPYINQDISDIAELEQRAFSLYGAVTGGNFTTEQRVYVALKEDVVPMYGRFVALLREIRPKTTEVQRIHGSLVRGAEKIHRGFRAKMLGIEAGDPIVVDSAEREIIEGQLETLRWRRELLAACEAYRVVPR